MAAPPVNSPESKRSAHDNPISKTCRWMIRKIRQQQFFDDQMSRRYVDPRRSGQFFITSMGTSTTGTTGGEIGLQEIRSKKLIPANRDGYSSGRTPSQMATDHPAYGQPAYSTSCVKKDRSTAGHGEALDAQRSGDLAAAERFGGERAPKTDRLSPSANWLPWNENGSLGLLARSEPDPATLGAWRTR